MTLSIKQGEVKPIKFTVTNNGAALDLTGSTFTFEVEDTPGVPLFTIANASFDITDIATGVIRAPLTAVETNNPPRTYKAELKIALPGGEVEKTVTYTFVIERAITP